MSTAEYTKPQVVLWFFHVRWQPQLPLAARRRARERRIQRRAFRWSHGVELPGRSATGGPSRPRGQRFSIDR